MRMPRRRRSFLERRTKKAEDKSILVSISPKGLKYVSIL
jgi:hypothetical protein